MYSSNGLESGMGFDPATAAAVTQAGVSAAQFVASLFGAGRGEYQKFSREINPILSQHVQRTGQPSFCLWFGEAVGIDVAGKLVVMGQDLDVAEYKALLQHTSNEMGQPLQSYEFGRFVSYTPRGTGISIPGLLPGPAQPPVVGAGFAPMDISPVALIALGVGGLLLLRGFRT